MVELFRARWTNSRRSERYLEIDKDFVTRCFYYAQSDRDVIKLISFSSHNCSPTSLKNSLNHISSIRGKIETREKKFIKRRKEGRKKDFGTKCIPRRQSETNPSISPRVRNERVTSTRRGGVIGLIGDAGPIVERDKQRQKTSTPVLHTPDDHPRSNAYSWMTNAPSRCIEVACCSRDNGRRSSIARPVFWRS